MVAGPCWKNLAEVLEVAGREDCIVVEVDGWALPRAPTPHQRRTSEGPPARQAHITRHGRKTPTCVQAPPGIAGALGGVGAMVVRQNKVGTPATMLVWQRQRGTEGGAHLPAFHLRREERRGPVGAPVDHDAHLPHPRPITPHDSRRNPRNPITNVSPRNLMTPITPRGSEGTDGFVPRTLSPLGLDSSQHSRTHAPST